MLITFIVTAWLLAMLPGVGQALMLRQTLVYGADVARATIAGTATGLVVWTLAAAAGLSALLLAEPGLYRVLLLAGGAFLAFVGLRTLWSVRRPAGESAVSVAVDPPASGRRTAYLTGLATNLGNPKAGVFALSLLPRFAGATEAAFWTTLALGVLWSAVTAAWYLLFVALVARGRGVVSRPGVQRGVSVASGAVLLALGASVALEA
ncbi:LysE family translocator [Nocardioides sp. WS12]|uniref:LysE family translocator n=1 Tax=Nocardioides sp. WS12 TaxID=2486272 RepID=UPI0015FE2F79|nr:LysE family translocator [Nocardioides sp. WS12]